MNPDEHPWLKAQEYLVCALVAAGVTIGILAEVMVPLVQSTEDTRPVRILTVTAYSPRVAETDSTPFINAAGTQVAEGQIAVSRDLFMAGWVFGRKVWVQGYGIYTVADLMNARYRNRVDIFMFSTKNARAFGKKQLVVALLGGE